MKSLSGVCRHPPRVPSTTFQQLLNKYTLAATAAGVGTLALPAAEAKVIYTPAHVVIKVNDTYNLDLNQDGIADFILRNTSRCNTDQCFWDLFEKAPHKNGVLGTVFSGFGPFVSALPNGVEIGPNAGNFYKGKGWLATFYYGGGGPSSHGKWRNVEKRYLGLKFHINGEVHYGWARLNVKVTDNPIAITGTLTGYAYQTVANKPIIAGKTADEAGTRVLGSTSLGGLALGAQGLTKHRGGNAKAGE